MEKSVEAAKAAFEAGENLEGEEAIAFYAQLIAGGLAILRGVKGDQFVDGFLNAALKDKTIITLEKKTMN